MIRKFKIWNEKYDIFEGYLFYNTETKKFSIEVNLDAPKFPDIFFKDCADQGIVNPPQHWVDAWIESRVITPNRQGLDWLLKQIGMDHYDTFDILVYGNGRCQMDYSMIIEEKD